MLLILSILISPLIFLDILSSWLVSYLALTFDIHVLKLSKQNAFIDFLFGISCYLSYCGMVTLISDEYHFFILCLLRI